MEMNAKKRCCLLLTLLLTTVVASAQKAGVKTNLVDDALLNVHLGIEAGLAPKWTVDVPASYNSWSVDEARWKHWWVQPGIRYWFCDRFSGHFVGVHAHGGQYNIGGFDGKVVFPGWNGQGEYVGTDFRRFADVRYQGWFVGGGISYGYAWVIGTHWNIEAEVGIGYAYTRYDRFKCTGCGKKEVENAPHHYIGPTKAAINLVYLF